jgi:hypothetical protein
MFEIELPGGVVAGVVGIDRALLRPVSMDKGWAPVTPLPMVGAPHSYELPWLPIPITLEALVGGVGKVCARSKLGRPAPGWGAMECGVGGTCAPPLCIE